MLGNNSLTHAQSHVEISHTAFEDVSWLWSFFNLFQNVFPCLLPHTSPGALCVSALCWLCDREHLKKWLAATLYIVL